MTHTMVVGTTEAQSLQVLQDGAAHDYTGMTIGLSWRGTVPTGTPVIAWDSITVGTVLVTSTGSMPVGKHLFRFVLTDSGGKVGYVPNLDAEPNTWLVVRV